MEEILKVYITKYFDGAWFNQYNANSIELAESMLAEMVAAHPEFNELARYTHFEVSVNNKVFLLYKEGTNEFSFGHFGSMKMFELGKPSSASVHEHVGWRHRN